MIIFTRKERDRLQQQLLDAMHDKAEAERRADKAEARAARAIEEAEKKVRCSFCGKSQFDVKKMIAGPAAFICNECVAVCVDVCIGEVKP